MGDGAITVVGEGPGHAKVAGTFVKNRGKDGWNRTANFTSAGLTVGVS